MTRACPECTPPSSDAANPAHAGSKPYPTLPWAALILKAPIHAYQWTLRPWLGWPCRHLPTCSDYGLEAIETNGAWRGGWLTLSRLCRCQPWGTHGYDPVPDLRRVRYPLYAAFRYGRWTGRHL